MSDRRTLSVALLFAMGAGALWGFVFLAPALIPAFSPIQIAVGRYLAYGIASLVLILPSWRLLLKKITLSIGMALLGLSFIGNILYYILLSKAVQTGGVAMTSLVLGFMPVAVMIIGSKYHGSIGLTRLIPSLFFCIAGILSISWQAIETLTLDHLSGLFYAFSALATWTAYAIINRSWLISVDSYISAYHWNLLLGIVTGIQAFLLMPIAFIFLAENQGQFSGSDLLKFAAICSILGIFSSIIGSAFWNQMSKLIPLTLVGSMILFETLFALIYGLLWEERLPTLLETITFLLIVLSVLSCVLAHNRAHHSSL